MTASFDALASFDRAGMFRPEFFSIEKGFLSGWVSPYRCRFCEEFVEAADREDHMRREFGRKLAYDARKARERARERAEAKDAA